MKTQKYSSMKRMGFPIFIFVLTALSLATRVSATRIDIGIEESFYPGNEITFEYAILSDVDVDAVILPSVICPEAPAPMQMQEYVPLFANKVYESSYSYGKISDSVEPQTCTAFVSILSPSPQTEPQASTDTKIRPVSLLPRYLCYLCLINSKLFGCLFRVCANGVTLDND